MNPHFKKFELLCNEGNVKLAQEILRRYFSRNSINKIVSDDRETPLFLSIKTRNLELVNLVLEKGANVNKGQVGESNILTPLASACRMGSVKIVKRLLCCRFVDVNKGSETYWYNEKRKMYDSETVTSKSSPLFEACVSGHVRVVKRLVKHPKIDVNKGYRAKQNSGNEGMWYPPLYVAAEKGNRPIAKVLLSHPKIKVNLNYLHLRTRENLSNERWQYSPLFIACKNDHVELVKLLVSDGRVDVECRCKNNDKFLKSL